MIKYNCSQHGSSRFLCHLLLFSQRSSTLYSTLHFLPQHLILMTRAPQTFGVTKSLRRRVGTLAHGSGAGRIFQCRISRKSPSSEHPAESPSSEHQPESPSSAQPLQSPRSRPANQSRRTLSVPPVSRRALGTQRSETWCSEQTLRDRRVWKRAAAGRRASTDSTAT